MGVKPFIKYLTIKFKKEAHDEIYRVYVCNCLKVITKNTAKSSGGSYIDRSFASIIGDISEDNATLKQKQKSSDDIIANVVAKGGLKFTKKGVK